MPVNICFLNGYLHMYYFFALWDRKMIIQMIPSNCSHVLVINYLLLLFRSICEFSTEEASPFLFKQYRQNYKLYPAGIYLLKVNNRNTRTRCEICSKLTIKTPERRLASF